MTAKRKPEHISQEDWDSVDVPEFTDEELSRMRPATEVLPEVVAAHETGTLKRRRGQRGPQKAPKKIPLHIRFSPEVVEYFRATGRGWQTRMDEALKEWIAEHGGRSGE